MALCDDYAYEVEMVFMRLKVLIVTCSVLYTSNGLAGINMSEVNAYAYEGLASICATSRKISGAQAQEMKAIHVEKKRERQKRASADTSFSYYAAKQLWGIQRGDSPSYEECSALLK